MADIDETQSSETVKIVGSAADGTEQGLVTSTDGSLNVREDGQKSAFGHTIISELAPYINLIATRGIRSRSIETFTSGTGSSADVQDFNPGKSFRVQCGTDVGGFGVLRSKKTLSYRPGIGSVGRFTATFDTPVANSIQRAGLFNIGNEFTFGYNGTDFSILRRTGGRPEIRKLTINTASNQSTNITITLNGTAYVVAVTNASAAVNAFEIVDNFDWEANGWSAYNIGESVYFQARSTGAKAGTYTATPAAGNFAGIFSTIQDGTTETDVFVNQANWNKTTLTTSDDPFILDPTQGNVYQIQMQYLGHGAINFFIENPNTGQFVLVHQIQYANANAGPSSDLPEFKLGILCASTGSTTNLSVTSACLAGFHEGSAEFPKEVNSFINSKTSIGSTLTNVLALKKTTIANDAFSLTDAEIKDISAAVSGNKPSILEIRLNPIFSDTLSFENIGDTAITAATDGGTVTGGTLIFAASLGQTASEFINAQNFDIILTNDDVLSIAIRTTSGTTDAVASAVWAEK